MKFSIKKLLIHFKKHNDSNFINNDEYEKLKELTEQYKQLDRFILSSSSKQNKEMIDMNSKSKLILKKIRSKILQIVNKINLKNISLTKDIIKFNSNNNIKFNNIKIKEKIKETEETEKKIINKDEKNN